MAGSVGQYTQGWFPWQGNFSGVNMPARQQNSAMLGMGYINGLNDAQNNEIVWNTWLDTGTWKVCLVYQQNTNNGIYTIQFDGVSQGTIDAYAAYTTNVYSEITGLSVTAASVKAVKLLMATKNASSTNYAVSLNSVALIRTSGAYSTPSGSDTPGYTVEITPWMGRKTDSGFPPVQNSALLGGGRYSVADLQNQSSTWDVWLDSGTYKIACVHFDDANSGIQSLQLDGVEKATVDQYSAGGASNVYTESTGIALSAKTTPQSFGVKSVNKNASSGAYSLRTQSFKWIRTGA